MDPIIGCPADCAYCYLGPKGLKGSRPQERVPATQAVHLLSAYLAETRNDIGSNGDRTPIALGNYTDMLMTMANRQYLMKFATEMVHAGIDRPLVIVTKGRMPESLAVTLDELDLKTLVFHSQSFHRTTLDTRSEKGPVLSPWQTMEAGSSYHSFRNLMPIHFWRPITRKTVPSASWARHTVQQLKDSGFRCSVAIGLIMVADLDQHDLIQSHLLDTTTHLRGELWDEEVWADISAAARSAEYPVYRSTSCAVALTTGHPETLGVWDHRRGAAMRCLPCMCPESQRSSCGTGDLRTTGLDEPLTWIADYLGIPRSRFVELPGRRARVSAEIPQSMVSMALHKYQLELLPESVRRERAWLGRFGESDRDE